MHKSIIVVYTFWEFVVVRNSHFISVIKSIALNNDDDIINIEGSQIPVVWQYNYFHDNTTCFIFTHECGYNDYASAHMVTSYIVKSLNHFTAEGSPSLTVTPA